MDSFMKAAAQALAAGDPLGALKRVALRDDPSALALRGIAMAQLGDFVRAEALLKSAACAFGLEEAVPRARCIVAEAEIALASRNLGWPAKRLDDARAVLEAHKDWPNAAHARLLAVRRLVLIGRMSEAERALAELDPAALRPASKAIHELIVAAIALRYLQVDSARMALARAERAASRACIPALSAELQRASLALSTPVARLITQREDRLVQLDEVQRLMESGVIVVDACRHVVCKRNEGISLVKRPVLFALIRVLGEAWPADVSRRTLIERAFRTQAVDESHRARLRVEIGRLRALLHELVGVTATKRGFALAPLGADEVALLTRPTEEQHAGVLACLADGESWSSSALALALGTSQRSVQRALDTLATAGRVQSFGSGRSRRWMTSHTPGFATILLLPVSVMM